MLKPVRVLEIPEAEQTPLVRGLVGIIEEQAEQLRQQEELSGQLKDEIAVLKGEKKRPRFKASGMEEKAGQDEKESEAGDKKRAGSEKRSKTELVEIHEERVIAPEAIPAGSRFKGYEDYVVQGLIIRAHNTRYRLERWQTPAGGAYLLVGGGHPIWEEAIESLVNPRQSEMEQMIEPRFTPTHTHPFEALLNQPLTGTFH